MQATEGLNAVTAHANTANIAKTQANIITKQDLQAFKRELNDVERRVNKLSYLDTTGMGGNSKTPQELLKGILKNRYINLDDYLNLQRMDKKSQEYKALLKDIFLKRKKTHENIETLKNLDTIDLREFLNSYRNDLKNLNQEQLLKEKERVLQLPNQEEVLRDIQTYLLLNLENVMYPNFEHFLNKNKEGILKFVRDGGTFNNVGIFQPKHYTEIQRVRDILNKEMDINPLAEFGTNYAEFYRDGKGAIAKILAEAKDYSKRKASGKLSAEEAEQGAYKGQVAGAFYRKDLGNIDLVWGNDNFGLKHILEKRTQDFINKGLNQTQANQETISLINQIPSILENGNIYKNTKDKIEVITDQYTLVLGIRDDKKFILTELKDRRNKQRLENFQTGVGENFTAEPLANKPLSTNQDLKESVAQDILKDTQAQQEIKTTKDIIKEAKENKLSVKETKELIRKNTDANSEKIKEAKEFIKIIKKEQRAISRGRLNGLVTRRRSYRAKTENDMYVDYYHRLNLKLKYYNIDREYYTLEALKRNKDLSPKELKKEQEKLYLIIHDNIKKKNEKQEALAKQHAEQIKQEQAIQIHEWLEKNKGAAESIEKHQLETKLKNKVKEGGLLYTDKKASNILAEALPNKTFHAQLDKANLNKERLIKIKRQAEATQSKILQPQSSQPNEKLKNKTTSQLDKNELKKLSLISQKDFESFLENIENKQYKELPIIIKIADLNQDLNKLLNSNNASVFLTRARAAHIAQARKAKYNQALSIEEKLKIPQVINEAKSYYKDNKSGYILPFKDETNESKINLIVLDKDNKGNFLITAKKDR